MSFVDSGTDIHKLSQFKRFMEYCAFVSEFEDAYRKNPDKTLNSIELDITAAELGKAPVKDENGTESERAYWRFMDAKFKSRDGIREACKPSNPHYYKWRERQESRCMLEFSIGNASAIVHTDIAFELSSGCSVGCKFCGLNAGKLSKVFRYTDENAAMWKGVLDAAAEVIGDSVRMGMLYYATEPLDNPDYECFMRDWREKFGRFPQITTAAGTRNIERTRKIFNQLRVDEDTIYRMSIKSKEEFDAVMHAFTPEELLLVECLPQYEEAPGNHFTKSGRSAETGEYDGTIACVSGFIVNMANMTITMVTPVTASSRFPLGQIEMAREEFTDAEDFKNKLTAMIAGMKTVLSPKEQLKLYDYLSVCSGKNGHMVKNQYGTEVRFDGSTIQPFIGKTLEMLKEGGHTRKEIGEQLQQIDSRMDPVSIYSIINKMWNNGFIIDEQLFG